MLHSMLLGAAVSFCLGQTADNATSAPPSPTPIPVTTDRWMLMRLLSGTYPGSCLADARVRVLGWTEMAYTGSSVAHDQLPMGFNYLANQPQLTQNYLRIERPVRTDELDWGFRSDTILPGTDYRFTLAHGLFSSQLAAHHGAPNTYGVDPIQFYAEGNVPNIGRGLDVKLGRLLLPYGVEAVPAVDTFFVSRAYTFIYNPFTQFGALGTLQLTPTWSVVGMVSTGNDMLIAPGAEPTVDLGCTWVRPGGRNSVTFFSMLSQGRYHQAQRYGNPVVFDLVYRHRVNPRLNYYLETLTGYQLDVPTLGDVWWLGVVHYISYQLSPRLAAVSRLEFFNDPSGYRTGSPGLYTAPTTGLNFQYRPGLLLRPEIRYDYNDRSPTFQGQHGVVTAAFDVVVRW
jgi:hypothetical protein